METASRQRVLHVVENLHRGAVENWLVRMFRHGKQQGAELDWTFYCQVGREGAFDAEVLNLGGKIIHSKFPIGSKAQFVQNLRVELKNSRYDILHCHHDLISAMYLAASFGIPIRRRIVHVHNADGQVLTPKLWKQRLLKEPLRWVCLALADRIVGISQHTLDTFLKGRERRPKKDLVHYYGVDSSLFENSKSDRFGLRLSLGVPPDSILLLFAGRMVPEKNPVFAVEVLAELKRLNPLVYGVFVGTGSLEVPAQNRAKELGLNEATRFLGWRTDIPEIMAACDWFILPHPEKPMEGFGLAVVEAQLAGLRLLLSPGIADDPLLPTACFGRVPLAAGPAAWAKAAMDLLAKAQPARCEALAALKCSPFDMDFALQALLTIYQ